MAGRKRRSFTSEQRQAVLATVRTKGVSAAAREHGIAQSCVSRWAWAARVTGGGSGPTPSTAAMTTQRTEKAQRTAKARVAKVYTPSQKAEVLEYASEHGVMA